jgi:hypothetical protein
MTPRFSPDQSQQINHLADGRSFGEGQLGVVNFAWLGARSWSFTRIWQSRIC